jgi:tetrapyrrole methylase family protein/MazG family protein
MPYLLEEVYEVLETIESKNSRGLSKELGDLLFQIVLLAQIAEEKNQFDMRVVLKQINQKMIDRHPHVFDATHQNTQSDGSIESWESRKAKERTADASALAGVPRALPALLRAHRITEKASRVGFDWPSMEGARNKLNEEISEFDAACASGDPEEIAHEFGDILFTMVNIGRFLPLTPEASLRAATIRFEQRFRYVEKRIQETGRSIHEAGLDELENLWVEAKREE